MDQIGEYLPPVVQHSLTAAGLFIVIAMVAYGIDRLVTFLHSQGASRALCAILHGTALVLVALDCIILLNYAVFGQTGPPWTTGGLG